MSAVDPEQAGPGPAAGRDTARVGVDLVRVERIGRLLAEHPGRVHELFTPREIAYCRRKRQYKVHFAGRFAAKEAVLKALGAGLGRQMRWTDVEVVNGPLGKPGVSLRGEVAASAARRGLAGIDVSLSHSAGLAIAGAVTHGAETTGRAIPSDRPDRRLRTAPVGARAQADLRQRGALGGPADDPVMPPPWCSSRSARPRSWLIVATTERRKRAALLQIGSVSFLGDVRPGDVLELQGEVRSMSEEMAVISGTVSVGAWRVLEATDIMCALIDADDLQDWARHRPHAGPAHQAGHVMSARVAITGLGAVTPVGNDADATWEALIAGRSGVGPITTFDASTFPVRIGGMVSDFDAAPYLPDPRLAPPADRAASFGVAAAGRGDARTPARRARTSPRSAASRWAPARAAPRSRSWPGSWRPTTRSRRPRRAPAGPHQPAAAAARTSARRRWPAAGAATGR